MMIKIINLLFFHLKVYGIFKNYYSVDELISKYGYVGSKESIKIGDSWDVILIGGGSSEQWTSGSGNHTADEKIIVKAYELYSGDDYQKGEQEQLKDGTDFVKVDTIGEAIKKSIGKVLGKLFMMLLDLYRGTIGDGPQMILNSLQTSNYAKGFQKIKPWAIAYESKDILEDKNKNSYVNFSEDGSNEGADNQIPKNEEADENGFDKETEVPIIPVDVYSIVTGQIKEFDVNFFKKQSEEELSEWLKIRNNFTTTLLHIIIYVSSALLLGLLVWNGISIAFKSLTPGEKEKKVGMMNEFVVSVLMLVGSVVVMNLCIYFSDSIVKSIKVADTNEPPIRVILNDDDEKIYSFSTNITGYARYMSQITKVEQISQKFTYTLFYVALVWVNIITVICLFIRSFVLIVLSFMGPILAVLHSIQRESVLKMTFQDWVIQYLGWTSIIVFLALIYKIMLIVSF